MFYFRINLGKIYTLIMLNFLTQAQGMFLHFFKSFLFFYSSTVKLSSTKSCLFFLKFILRYFICFLQLEVEVFFFHDLLMVYIQESNSHAFCMQSPFIIFQLFTNQYILKLSLIVAVAVCWIKLLHHNSSDFMRIDIIQKSSFQNKTIQYPIGQSITLIPRSVYALLYNWSIKREIKVLHFQETKILSRFQQNHSRYMTTTNL